MGVLCEKRKIENQKRKRGAEDVFSHFGKNLNFLVLFGNFFLNFFEFFFEFFF